MRKLNRNIHLASFPSQFTGQQRIDWEFELLMAYRSVKLEEIERIPFKGKSSRWKNAKENLIRESKSKCAYCECLFTTVAYGDVEHYRPKSKYWWLAYSYHNYTAACQLCNQKYKKAKFPITKNSYKPPKIRKNNTDKYLLSLSGSLSVDPLSNEGMTLEAFRKIHTLERPLSIDPYLDDPEDYFAYDYNDRTKEVIMVEKNKSVKNIVESSIELFGLNRKELRDLRYRGLLQYRFLRQVSETSSDVNLAEAADNVLKDLYYAPKSQFSGMYNYFKDKSIKPI